MPTFSAELERDLELLILREVDPEGCTYVCMYGYA